jgi:hypothetical protein
VFEENGTDNCPLCKLLMFFLKSQPVFVNRVKVYQSNLRYEIGLQKMGIKSLFNLINRYIIKAPYMIIP